MEVVSYQPEPSDVAWTFGGVEPVMKRSVAATSPSEADPSGT
jgi:hypothetical protein